MSDLIRILRKMWRVYVDFPMNWQVWGWERTDMSRGYWLGYSLKDMDGTGLSRQAQERAKVVP